MEEREFFERWDRRLERSDEVMREIRDEVALTREEVRLSREQRDRSDAILQRNTAAFDRNTEAFERNAEQHSDLREFIREMIARMDRSGRETSEALRAQTAAFQSFVAEVRAEMRDLRDESRAQTKAILKLLDRFDGPQPGNAA